MNNYNSVEFLRMQFLCCTPLNKFKWPDLNYADEVVQQQIINATVKDNIILKYPIKNSYSTAFIKILLKKLQTTGVEIVDDIYTALCDNISTNDESTMCYKHFILNHQSVSHLLSMKESTSIISQGTTGLCSWEAAFYLAEWCILNKQKICGKNILELGSGVGLTGLAVIYFCEPVSFYFSDCHPSVLKTLEENIRLNLLEKQNEVLWKQIESDDSLHFQNVNCEKKINVHIKNLLWEEIKSNTKQMQIDVVIAADILYDSSNFESLAIGLNDLLCNNVSYAIVAATIRNESTICKFLNLLEKYGLCFTDEESFTPKIFFLIESTPVRILKITKVK